MKKVLSILTIISFLFLPMAMTAQVGNSLTNTVASSCLDNQLMLFSDCAAIYFEDKMLVNDYSPTGVCTVNQGSEGKLTVSAINLTTGSAIPYENVGFKVAIKDFETGTLTMFSEETFKAIEMKKILAKCSKGDKIVLITVNPQYSLPHNEIEVIDGC